ncbi:MAG: glycosyltransferase [Gemmatimonadota bacterium]
MTASPAGSPTGSSDGGQTVAPIGVFEWELSAPVPSIGDTDRYLAVRFLVRLHGRPVGWLYLGPDNGQDWESRLRAALQQQLAGAVQRAVLRQQMDASSRPAVHAPSITVVVCTRDRPDSLVHCLASLLELDYPEFEVVVVDNAPSSDATARLVARMCEEDCRARALLLHVVEPTPGLDWARNRGASSARHAIIAFTDDDVRVDRDWLRAIGQGFANDEVECVTGLVVPGELETDAQVFFEDFYGGMGKGMRSREFRQHWMDERARIGAHHVGVGANLSLRRDWLRRLGGFDTALDVGTPSHGGGDLDILHRTLAAGGVVRYDAEAIVRHYHRRSMAALRRQLRDNGRAFGVYLLTRWRLGLHSPRVVLRYAVGTWLGWMLGRIPRRLRRRERLPLPLQLEEWIGAVQAPWAWRATYAHDRRVRRAAGLAEAGGIASVASPPG